MANEPTTYRLGGGGAGKLPRAQAMAGKSRASWRAWAMALAWWLVALLVLALPFTLTHPYPTHPGDRAPSDVKAPYEFSVEDRAETEKALAQIAQTIDNVWTYDDDLDSRVMQRLQSFLTMLREENPSTSEKLRAFVQDLDDQLGIVIDMTTANQFQPNRLHSLRPPLTLERVQDSLIQTLSALFNQHPYIVADKVAFRAQFAPQEGSGKLKIVNKRGIPMPLPKSVDEVLWWPDEVRNYLAGPVGLMRYFPGEQYQDLRQAALELMMSLLDANLKYDRDGFAQQYELKYRERANNPVRKTYKTGELIVKQGEPLTQLSADALSRLNEMNRNTMAIKLGGIILITLIFFVAVGVYLARFRRDVTLTAPMITLHVLPPLLAIIIGQVMVMMKLGETLVTLWFPAAMVGLLSSILMTPQVAFVLALVAASLFGIVADLDLSFFIFALFSGFAAVFASRRVRARGEVLLVGVQVGVINIITLIILSMLKAMQMPSVSSLVAALLSGVLCAFGTLILLVLFERMFGIITDLRLLELTGLRNPLIAQFEEKSPGSYQHVLSVVKLAEAAAQAIGANYLLTRAGAYFHDIGKMIKPKYFSENQVTLDDKKAHSRLSPNMSVLIIKNHVKEGVELARRFHLPEKVIDFIPQHHGTGLIRYFYSEAMKRWAESGAIDEPREEDFRYPGPKPQTIEAAVVMLADSVEAVASSRFTGGQVSEGELRKLVQTAITEKFDDGQFDECDLTMRHLHLIRESFVKTLMGRFHFRVAYPTLPPKREAAAPAAPGREPAIAIAGPGGAPDGR